MRSSPSPALLLAALWACAPAPATETRSGVSGLIGASTSTTTDHPEAVAVLATYGGQGQVFCSGVQILPDVITDRGWVPHERQIGTTGVVVDPQLYIAFGVSGACLLYTSPSPRD